MLEGLSINQISKEIFSSKPTVRKALLAAGIPMEDRRRRSALTTSNQQNLNPEIVQLISKLQSYTSYSDLGIAAQKLHQEGHGLRSISKLFNMKRVQTRSGLEHWHPQTIARLLKAAQYIRQAQSE